MAERTLQTRSIGAYIAGALLFAVACFAATQSCAKTFAYQGALGRPLLTIGSTPIYAPFSILQWSERWSATYPRAFVWPKFIVLLGFVGAAGVLLIGLRALAPPSRPFGASHWGNRADALSAGLFATSGIVLGRFAGEIIAYDGPHHVLLTGGTRSGKTRGAVVPTLLATPHSVLALDLKGELHAGDARVGFSGTAGWRAQLGAVIRFDPTSPTSDRLNLLDTIRPGPQEVRDVQNLTELIADPYGDQRFQEFWDRAAKQIVAGVILHVAYAEPAERKTLYRVFELLARFDDTVKLMEATLHRLGADGKPETHPEVRRAAQSYAAYHEKLRAGIKATAESYLGLFADPLVQQNTSASTFRISDLMCADRPVTLYLCWPPNDSKRVKPLMRLVFGAVLRDLMEHQERAADGRAKKRPLLLLLDEFPQLGKLDLFEQSMGAMAGYGVRAFIVTQSLHQVTQAYGRYHTILDNCQIVTSFAATDVETADTISQFPAAMYLARSGDIAGARELLADARAALAGEVRDQHLILNNSAAVDLLSDAPDFASCREALTYALRLAGDDFTELTILNNLGIAYRGEQNWEAASDCADRCMLILNDHDFADTDIYWPVSFNASQIYRAAGLEDKAAVAHRFPLERTRERSDNKGYWAFRYGLSDEIDEPYRFLASREVHPVYLSHWLIDLEGLNLLKRARPQ